MSKRVIFMGTPQFAVSILETLLTLPCEVVAVVSQPDRKVGRQQVVQATPVKERAIEKGISVLQPIKINDAYDELASLNPDLIVTCAYGQFIPSQILALPNYGCVNVHASLLPKYRGGAPIHMAVINGETESGITLMRMVKKMDAGAILFQDKVKIDENETMGSLSDKLMICGSQLLAKQFEQLFKKDLIEIEQDESQVSFAPNILPELEFIHFHRSSDEIVHHINGLSPSPVGYGLIQDKKMKFFSAFKKTYEGSEEVGTILGLVDNALAIKSQDGMVCISDLQLEGKKRMDAVSFWTGYKKQLEHNIFKESL